MSFVTEQKIIEKNRYKLAFLKRNRYYKKSFKKLKINFQIDEHGLFPTVCEDILICEMGFSIDSMNSFCKAKSLELIDPTNKKPACSDNFLFFLFNSSGIEEICRPDLRLFFNTKESLTLNGVDLKNHERLLKVDLRKSKKNLVEEFKGFLNNIHTDRKIYTDKKISISKSTVLAKEVAVAWDSFQKRKQESFKTWEQDNSRIRKEAETQLKVWDLWKQGKGFKKISKELERQGIDITVDSTKQAFHRAYEQIYNKKYDSVDVWKNEIKIEKSDLEMFRKDCPKKPCRTCANPCPEVYEFMEKDISQDHIPQEEVLISQLNMPEEDCEKRLSYLKNKNSH